MKVLAEKDTQIFEDDDKEYGELKKYSMGQSVKDTSKDGGQYHYYKDAVSVEIQDYFDPRETEIAAQIPQIDTIANPSDLEENIKMIFEATGKSGNDDSVLNLKLIYYETKMDDYTSKDYDDIMILNDDEEIYDEGSKQKLISDLEVEEWCTSISATGSDKNIYKDYAKTSDSEQTIPKHYVSATSESSSKASPTNKVK